MISRDEALALARQHIKKENTIKHMFCTEAIMRTLAERFAPEEVELWGLAGLLHDLDYEETGPKEHTFKTVEILKEAGADLPDAVYKTIQAHNYVNDESLKPTNKMEWSLFIIDSLTGLIVATALVRPDRKLASVEVKSVLKKFKDKSFAAGTRREDILHCEPELGLSLAELVELSLKSLQEIASDLGL